MLHFLESSTDESGEKRINGFDVALIADGQGKGTSHMKLKLVPSCGWTDEYRKQIFRSCQKPRTAIASASFEGYCTMVLHVSLHFGLQVL